MLGDFNIFPFTAAQEAEMLLRIVAAALGVIALPSILGAWQLWAATGGGAVLA